MNGAVAWGLTYPGVGSFTVAMRLQGAIEGRERRWWAATSVWGWEPPATHNPTPVPASASSTAPNTTARRRRTVALRRRRGKYPRRICLSLQAMGEHGPCVGCSEVQRLGRRRFLQLLASGVALALAGCTSEVRSLARRKDKHPEPAVAGPAPIVDDAGGGPPLALGNIPSPRPGAPQVVSAGPKGTQQIALTVDDGYCGDCIAQYVSFAQRSGIHLTLNPNGTYNELWTPSIVSVVREMVADKQVQIGNHTWDHANLLPLSNSAISHEISRNEEWIEQTFGVTARPYFRPPYGYYNERVKEVAAELGYTTILMWNGTFGDATPETPTQIIGLAEQWLRPGTIMLGHLNHPAILGLFDQIESIISSRNLQPVTLDEMFGTSRTTG